MHPINDHSVEYSSGKQIAFDMVKLTIRFSRYFPKIQRILDPVVHTVTRHGFEIREKWS